MYDESKIRNLSVERVSSIFGISVDEINLSDRFGVELKESFVSEFKENELDKINNDIHDVATNEISLDLAAGKIVIRTLKDYCDLMVKCYRDNKEEVSFLLR